MKRKVEFVMAVVCALALFGCQAVPDGDDVDRLRERVAMLPDKLLLQLRVFAANRVAYGWLSSRDYWEKMGEVICQDQKHEFLVKDVLYCLRQYQDRTYKTCLDMMPYLLEYDYHYGEDCELLSIEARYLPDQLPSEVTPDEERVTVDDVVRALLGPPPPVEIQLLLIGAGGFAGPGGVLCAQSVDWACADNPLDDAPPTTSASSGGGDR